MATASGVAAGARDLGRDGRDRFLDFGLGDQGTRPQGDGRRSAAIVHRGLSVRAGDISANSASTAPLRIEIVAGIDAAEARLRRKRE